MIQQTVHRVQTLAQPGQFWIITNADCCGEIYRQLPRVRKKQVVAEPVGRNTAPAIGLAAFILLRKDPNAVLGLFPSDQVIRDCDAFRKVLKQGIEIAASGENIVVLGIKPNRPETGYGYIESGDFATNGAQRVRRFTEKPNTEKAGEFLLAGNFFWNPAPANSSLQQTLQ